MRIRGHQCHVIGHCNSLFYTRMHRQLFNFDLEVRPLLEVLVGKTVEQALLEVMEEEELASLRAQQVTPPPSKAVDACRIRLALIKIVQWNTALDVTFPLHPLHPWVW